MPIFRSGKGLAPDWCELEYFEIVEIKPGQSRVFERIGQKEKLMVGSGKCRVSVGEQAIDAEKGANLDLSTPGEQFKAEGLEDTKLIRMCGRWGDEVGGSGIFAAWTMDDPHDTGDPVIYPKGTGFDNHFHDCDEYWIVIGGSGVAVSEGVHYDLGVGDCLATRMGDHHDLPIVHETLVGVFFETTLRGQKRLGHLWEHTHGKARNPRANCKKLAL